MPASNIPVETLIEQLHSADWMTRCDAARLLGKSRDPRAVDALLPDLNDPDWRVRRNAVQALGALRDQRAVEPLIRVLQDRVMTVRQRAAVALGRIKDPRALPALLDVLLAGRRESYDAAKAVRKFGKKALPEIAKAFERSNNRDLMLLLIDMKYEGAFDLILKLMHSSDESARETAIREFGRLGDKKAIPYLIEQLNDNNPIIQSEAIRTLGKLDARETIPTLLDLLVDDELYGPRTSLYHAVTEALQMFSGVADEIKNAFPGSYPAMFNMAGAPISLPEVMGLVGNDPFQEALSKLPGGMPRVINMPPGIPDDVIRKVVEEMSWKFGVMFADARDANQDRVRRLMELLTSGSGLTRAAAALTLPWYGDERALESLGRLKKDPEEMVSHAATWAYNTLQQTIELRRQLGH